MNYRFRVINNQFVKSVLLFVCSSLELPSAIAECKVVDVWSGDKKESNEKVMIFETLS